MRRATPKRPRTGRSAPRHGIGYTGRTKVVAGSLVTKAQALTAAVLPDQVKAVAHRVITRPGSGA